MRFSAFYLLLLASLPFTAARAELDGALRDAAARVDYGWFTQDAALIASARESLAGRAGSHWRDYLLAYAAWREAELHAARGRDTAASIELCERHAEAAAGTAEAEAEATLLIAACAALAARAEPLRSVLHQRRLRQALARAEAMAPDNPRRLLIAARYAPDIDSAVALEAAMTAFREHGGRHDFPAWGEAEALMLASRLRLEAGELRAARDLAEQALLIAPDYAGALEIRQRLLRLAAAD